MDDLVKYRLDNAKERLSSAKLLLDAGNYKDSISRPSKFAAIVIIAISLLFLSVMQKSSMRMLRIWFM